MSNINCHECGHSIDSHYCLFTEDGYPEWYCDGGDHCDCHQSASTIACALLAAERENPRDEYHTMDELYHYRMLYNALSANLMPENAVKSWRHSDGELCFGGGWFIVSLELPTGQVSNHYKAEHWGIFQIPEVETAPEWDGHTPSDAASRLLEAAKLPPATVPADRRW